MNLFKDKRIWYEFPLQITLNCPVLDYETYPLDEQVCLFFIGSYQYDEEQSIYRGNMFYNKYHQRPLQYGVKEIVALPFEEGLVNYSQYYSTSNGKLYYENDTYSHFGIKMVFTRQLQPHLISTYIASTLLVVSSWVGFLIEPASVPG